MHILFLLNIFSMLRMWHNKYCMFVVRLHGMPASVVSDRDKIFTSLFWRELFRLSNTKLITSTAYHPQIDGQTERVNRCLEMYLRCCVHDNPKKWKCWLPLAEFWYNSSYHLSLGCTPFKVLYGYDPQVISAPMLPSTDNKSVQDLLSDNFTLSLSYNIC
jgi:hypothetical protein